MLIKVFVILFTIMYNMMCNTPLIMLTLCVCVWSVCATNTEYPLSYRNILNVGWKATIIFFLSFYFLEFIFQPRMRRKNIFWHTSACLRYSTTLTKKCSFLFFQIFSSSNTYTKLFCLSYPFRITIRLLMHSADMP